MRTLGILISVLVASTSFAGNFQKIKEIPNRDPILFGPGCATPGQHAPKLQFDPRLQNGSVHEYKYVQTDASGLFKSANYVVTAQNISLQKLEENYNLISVKGINYSGQTSGSATCWMNESNTCQFIPSASNEFAMLVWDHDYIFRPEFCTVTNTLSYTLKTFKGVYMFPSGKTVEAFQIIQNTNAEIFCLDGYIGVASEIYSEVVSNVVPSRPKDRNFCGGVKLLTSTEIKVGSNSKSHKSLELLSQR
ncbi:MAG: hypothetical protein AB7F59_02335 [Bdellovibrionales bacterium]